MSWQMLEAARTVERSKLAARAWRKLSVRERANWIGKLRIEIAAHLEDWVRAICSDIGKPGLDALSGDILTTLEMIRYYEKNAIRILKNRNLPGSGALFWGNRFYESYAPYGTVLVISPWNYPLQLALVPVISALVAGNSVVLKPSERSPRTARALGELFERVGFPKDVFILCEGDGTIASSLIKAGADKVFFTGSEKVGREVGEVCSSRFIPVTLELGGKDVMIVREDAHLKRAAKGAAYGAFLNAGQVCVGVKRILVHQSIAENFKELLKREIAAIRVGSSQDADMGAVLSVETVEKLRNQVNEAVKSGAQLESPLKIEGRDFHPLLLSDVPASSDLRQEESFGPVVLIDTYQTDADAIESANSSRFGLAASVWSKDIERAREISAALVVGSCSINNVVVQIANPVASFGGEKMSGVGRYHGADGLITFSRKKTVMLNRGRLGREINWFPYSKITYDWLKRLIMFRHSRWGIRWLKRSLGFLSLVFILSVSTRADEHASLVVRVLGIQKARGSLKYLLFHSEDGFPRDKSKAFRDGSEKVSDVQNTLIQISDLPYGEYALSVYQDENDNGKLDTGFLGIPREPVGASNDPKGRMGPPRYSEAKFKVYKPEVEMTVHLVSP